MEKKMEKKGGEDALELLRGPPPLGRLESGKPRPRRGCAHSSGYSIRWEAWCDYSPWVFGYPDPGERGAAELDHLTPRQSGRTMFLLFSTFPRSAFCT